MVQRRDADMTQGIIWRQLVRFALPMAVGLLFQQLYNTVDTYVVGQFVSTQALAAVGSTGPVINMMVGFFSGLATGASVVISQRYGAHDSAGLSRAVHTTITVTLIMCAMATALGLWLVEPMLRLMATPADVWAESSAYLNIYFSGVSGLLVYNMGSGILRAVGDSRRPLYFLIFSALLNTVLDLLFVRVFHMGVAGVAWATVIAQAVSAVLVLFILTREPREYGVRWRQLRLDPAALRSILAIGLPSGIQAALTSFSNVFVQSYINEFGADCMAGYGVYNKLDGFVLVPVQAIGMASTTFVGQNWGAGQPKRAREGVLRSLLLSIACVVVLGSLMLLYTEPLISFFTGEAGAREFGVRFARLVTPFYIMLCFTQIFGGALRGVGDATAPTVIMLASFVVFRQIYLYITRRVLNLSFVVVALAYPVGWMLCAALLVLWYRRSRLCRTT